MILEIGYGYDVGDTCDCCGVFLELAAFFFLSSSSSCPKAARISAMLFGKGLDNASWRAMCVRWLGCNVQQC